MAIGQRLRRARQQPPPYSTLPLVAFYVGARAQAPGRIQKQIEVLIFSVEIAPHSPPAYEGAGGTRFRFNAYDLGSHPRHLAHEVEREAGSKESSPRKIYII